MSITSLSDWSAVELAAQTHELSRVETPKVPPSTPEQQLAFCAVRCAELQARLYRLQGKANEALMWLCANDTDRAKQAIAQTILDL